MRYIIGIDLGTTNCALSFIDTEQPGLSVQLFAIPQLTAAGRVENLLTLPSFCYLTAPNEWPLGALKLPWKEESSTFVGEFAKIEGARVPTRLVKSAKSWLSNAAAQRRDKILPIDAADHSQRLSPVEASAQYLVHLKESWNASIAKGNPLLVLEEQEVILTVPASFDEVARTLTVEAARLAGYLHVTLIEEPQAAFYSWIAQHEDDWQTIFKEGQTILVCDVGGGTTDFSLIEIQEKGGVLSFQRMAVGDHLLLGGDNMDSAAARYLESKLQKENAPSLEPLQWLQLEAEARRAKEVLLSPSASPQDSCSIVLQGTGSAVIKGSITTKVNQEEIKSLLLNGFFGVYELNAALEKRKSRGFRSMGLPYEDEPSITKHLAHFLQQAKRLEKGVDYILYNGGAVKPLIFQEAIECSLKKWFPHTPLKRISSAHLDYAVARGAAYYGKARRGKGIKIGGGLPRSYYLKIDILNAAGESSSQALTLLARGSEEGKVFQPEQIFSLRSNTPIVFQLLTSHVRLTDKEGELVMIDPVEMQSLPLIQTLLRFGRGKTMEGEATIIPIRLGIRLTPIGTIEMWLDSEKSEHRWALEFQLRSASGQDSAPLQTAFKEDEMFELGYLEEAKKSIGLLFQKDSPLKPNRIMELLETQIGVAKSDWGPTILREFCSALLKTADKRLLSLEHEARWWNLAGFFLRPGYGFALDDYRIKELWKVILSDLNRPKSMDSLIQSWICFRRVAGGFSKGQQMQLSNDIAAAVFDKKTGKMNHRKKGEQYIYSEQIRALAAFERVDLSLKIRWGNALIEKIVSSSDEKDDYWALGRIGARQLVYGSIGQVVPRETCLKWIDAFLLKKPEEKREPAIFLLKQLARKTPHRELNLPSTTINRIIELYPDAGLEDWLLKEHHLTAEEHEQIYGDRLPSGIILDVIE